MPAASESSSLLPSTTAPQGSTNGAPAQPHSTTDWLLRICRTINFIASLVALGCAVAFGLALLVRSEAPTKDLYFYSGQAVRLFGIGIAGLCVMVETEWQRFLMLVPLLDSWAGHGVLQIFLGILTYREAYPRGTTDIHKSLQLYRSAASAAMVLVGTVYLFGAVLCIGAIKRACYQREEQLAAAAAELDALESRRRELERLLGTD